MTADNNVTRIGCNDMIVKLRQLGIENEVVLQVMRRIPRHRFIPLHMAHRAYDDSPVPIGCNQTISQPYIVALMTQSLELTGKEKVLEVGTGSGYQTAILSALAAKVYTVERIRDLLIHAQERLHEQGYHNIHFRTGDGSLGWPEEAPFDRILSAASSPQLPAVWSDQLKEGGLIVAPIGSRMSQTLMRYKKRDGDLRGEGICGCVFVPLIGEAGWQDA